MPPEDNNAPVFTEAQVAALTELIAKTTAPIVNGAVNTYMKRQPNVADEIKKAFTKENLQPIFAQLVEEIPDDGDSSESSGKGGSQQPGSKADPEIQRQLAKLAEDLEKEKAARQAALAEAAETKRSHEFGTARQKLYESLKPHANETLHDVWVDNLIHHKRLKVEDGSPLLEVEYAPAKGMPKLKEFLPLEEAITHLVASDEAKRFQPVPGTENGRGSPGPRVARRAGAASIDSKDPAERVRARLEGLGINYDNEFGS
jgi:hypothetical protein